MKGVNKAIIVGNLGRDPELRHMPSGDAVTTISVATSEKWKDKDGQMQERTEWHRIVFFGRLAEVAAEYLSKGRQVYVEGQIRTRKWQDSDGSDRYSTEIVAKEMQMLGGRGDGQDRPQQERPRQQDRPSAMDEAPQQSALDPDDDIPF